jgi:hypothetical protein
MMEAFTVILCICITFFLIFSLRVALRLLEMRAKNEPDPVDEDDDENADDEDEEDEDEEDEDEDEDDEDDGEPDGYPEVARGEIQHVAVYRGTIWTTARTFERRHRHLRDFLWECGLQYDVHAVPPDPSGTGLATKGCLYFWMSGPSERVVASSRTILTWINGRGDRHG